jgi:hypothetical protein
MPICFGKGISDRSVSMIAYHVEVSLYPRPVRRTFLARQNAGLLTDIAKGENLFGERYASGVASHRQRQTDSSRAGPIGFSCSRVNNPYAKN